MSNAYNLAPQEAHATLTGLRATVIFANGGPTELVAVKDGEDLRAAVLQYAARHAHSVKSSVDLSTSGDRGDRRFIVRGDGTFTTVEVPAPLASVAEDDSSAIADGLGGKIIDLGASPDTPLDTLAVLSGRSDVPAEPVRAEDAVPRALTRRQHASFLADGGGDAVTVKPEGGFRSFAGVFGIKVKPNQAAIQLAQDRRLVAQHWSGCHKIAVGNLKGGEGKTPTTAEIAAVFARFGGGGVLAWDNSETLGTLGWRTESGPYDTTVRDLLPAVDDLLAPSAGMAAIARYVHHQTDDRYDVLRSSPILFGGESRITADDFDRLLAVAERYYRLVVFDSGKDESGERWLRMLDASDQLVIPVLAKRESAEGVRAMLEELEERDEHSAHLARNAVVLVSEWPHPVDKGELKAVVGGLESMVRAVEVLPYDAGLKSGALRFDNLRPATQDVFVRTAAHAARGMTA